MSPKQEKIKAITERLKALRAMTTDKGCTEAEAMNAAKVAARLMANYDISESDLAATERGDKAADFDSSFTARARSLHDAAKCGKAIGDITGTVVYQTRSRSKGAALVFFGAESDRMFAEYLYDLIRAAMDYEWSRYLKSPERPRNINGRTLRPSFMAGMAARISDRLTDMIPAPEASTGTSLAIRKGDLARREFAQNGPRLREGRAKKIRYHAGAANAGIAAGNRVALGKSVTGNSGKAAPRAICTS